MKLLLINEVLGWSSTGKIAGDLAKEYEQKGWIVRVAYGRSGFVPEAYQKYGVRIGDDALVKVNAIKARILDSEGLNARNQTAKFLKWADQYNPDLLWLHNLHGYYINYELLFDWIKSRPQMQVKWTLHDCWALTGHCTYFTYAQCNQWKTQCGTSKCPQIREYPKSLIDRSKRNYQHKKRAFSGVSKLTLITPSKWLADLVEDSYLNEYPVEVHYNTINRNIFKPTTSDFRNRYGLENKKIVLAVANVWDERKGLSDVLELSKILDEQYVVVIVGLTDKQIRGIYNKFPNVIALSRTDNQQELVKIYSASDVFVNPSKEETFGMTTIEALACGTHVVVYKGSASEEISHEFGGRSVDQSPSEMAKVVKEIIEDGS